MNGTLLTDAHPNTFNKILTIQKLLEYLDSSPIADFPEILRMLQLSSDSLSAYQCWDPNSYKRNYITKNDRYELLLICWEANQQTPIHDHGGEDCWVYFLEGKFLEVKFADQGLHPSEEGIKTPGSISFMNDEMGFHRLKNISNGKSMTLHLYAKPIRSCRIFDENSQRFLNKEFYCGEEFSGKTNDN